MSKRGNYQCKGISAVFLDPSQDQVLGSLLDGRYQVSKLLGKGGMGNVYLAEETRLRRRCALKVLHPALAADRTHVERFLREAQTIAQLEHPNIVDIYAYGEEPSGIVWFAMELLVGEDLDARVKARAERPFTTHECCAWSIQIARAVAVVHDAGLIHRDLKTSNIFLAQRRDGEEIIKLLDFGIARPEEGSELTATGVALGTPSYMSPEQVRNTFVDRRSDIYSFGVLLFKLLTNRLPFSGEPIQVAMAQCTSPAPVPSMVAPEAGISPELDALVLRMMAKAPDERYQSMREVEDALGALLHTEAPELAPAVKPSRMGTASQVRLRPDITALPAISLVASTPSLSSTSDTATAATKAPATGPTTALQAPGRARSDRWLYMTTGISLMSVILVLGITMLSRKDNPPPEPAPILANTPAAAVVSSPPSLDPPGVEADSAGMRTIAPAIANPSPPDDVEPEPSSAPDPVPVPPPNGSVPSKPPEQGSEQPASPPEPPKLKPKPKPPLTPEDPKKQVKRKAQACRRTHKQVGGAEIEIRYSVSIDGKVSRVEPATTDELGKCLAAAVAETQFAPKVALGQRISL